MIRQLHDNGCSLPRGADSGNRTAVALGDLLAEGQTKARTFVPILCIEPGKRIEYAGRILLVKADAIVGNGDPGERHPRLLNELPGDRYDGRDVLPGKLQRIIDEVVKELVKQYRSTLDGRKRIADDGGVFFADGDLEIGLDEWE